MIQSKEEELYAKERTTAAQFLPCRQVSVLPRHLSWQS